MPSQLIVLFTSLPSLNSISRNLLLMPGSSFSWSCSSSQSSKWLKKYLEIPSMINRSLNDYISMVQDLDSSWQGGIVSRRTTVNVNVDRFHSSYLQSCFFFSQPIPRFYSSISKGRRSQWTWPSRKSLTKSRRNAKRWQKTSLFSIGTTY